MDVKNHNSDVFIFGLQYPEPKSTAAGSRMLQLMALFQALKYNIHFASAQPSTMFSENLNTQQIKTYTAQLNDKSTRDLLAKIQPQIVLFDRFITEEQFGWMVDETCPDALKILDTEDLHFLRENREKMVRSSDADANEFAITEKVKREIGAIYRCDITLMISKAEIEILVEKFRLSEDILWYLPFMFDIGQLRIQQSTDYKDRHDFVSIGNFKHAPNLDMVKYLYKNIWPNIRTALPKAEWHIYGAYLPQQVKEMHRPENGVVVKGRAEDALQTLKDYRVMLAPLRFGAGLKGKCLDSMQSGTPSVTSSIGAEGIAEHKDWPGFVEDDELKFVNASVELYQNKNVWQEKQNKVFDLLSQHFNKAHFQPKFQQQLADALSNLSDIRKNNLIGQLLKYHLHRSTKFMSLWIEEKNRNKNT